MKTEHRKLKLDCIVLIRDNYVTPRINERKGKVELLIGRDGDVRGAVLRV